MNYCDYFKCTNLGLDVGHLGPAKLKFVQLHLCPPQVHEKPELLWLQEQEGFSAAPLPSSCAPHAVDVLLSAMKGKQTKIINCIQCLFSF